MYAGAQNPTGPTYRTSRAEFREKLTDYREKATKTDRGLRPAGEDVHPALEAPVPGEDRAGHQVMLAEAREIGSGSRPLFPMQVEQP